MSISPEQISAWLEQAAQQLELGKASAAQRLLRQVLDWQAQPGQHRGQHRGLARGLELWRGHQPRKAAKALADYSAEHPEDFRALQVRAHLAIEFGAVDEAIGLLQHCLQLHPELQAPRAELCRLLARRQRYAEALEQVESLLREEPDNPEFLLLKAAQLDRSGQYQPAIEILQRLVQQQSESDQTPKQERASTLTALAMLLRTVGDQTAAINCLQQAIHLDPQQGWPWFQLSDLKTYRFDAQQTGQIRLGLEQALAGSMNEVHYAFALGRALESQQDIDDAFAAYQRGNRVRSALAPFDMAAFRRELAATAELFGAMPSRPAKSSQEADCPALFVVGLPRSGTTLVDQIITAHSDVDGTMELPIISTLIREWQQRQLKAGQIPYPAAGTQLQQDELQHMGEEYLRRARIQRGDARYFVDKMPFNFQYIGLIRNILPGACIVNVQRNPMAMGFSIYRQLFRFGQDWAFDLVQIGQYYLAYMELMRRWEQQDPGEIIHVQYETLVQSPDSAIKQLLQQLQLSDESGCYQPHENLRPVRTASSEQVRQPLYSHAMEYWQRFENHLQPLRQALDEARQA